MFRTPIVPKVSNHKIHYKDPVLMIGSCFTDNIGDLLTKNKFNALINPFGILYNPISICRLLNDTIERKEINQDWIIHDQGIYKHFDFHSDISSLTKSELIDKIDAAYSATHTQILESKSIIITLGSAFVYKHKILNDVVGNCHKIPAKAFSKHLLSVKEIVESFESLMKMIQRYNKDIQFIITVSPVRHMKDTLEMNAVSKATLRLASHQLANYYKNIHYFPAFEILMDDLRDYRFYESDMLHPNKVAIDYIWDLFQTTYFDNETLNFVKEWKKVLTAIHHRPFQPDSTEHHDFILNTIKKLELFKENIDITEELKALEEQL